MEELEKDDDSQKKVNLDTKFATGEEGEVDDEIDTAEQSGLEPVDYELFDVSK